jgi:prolyl oligopeptidase
LEDDNSAETAAWVTAQNGVTNAYLEKLPRREALRERLTKLWNYERFGTPWKRGNRYFHSYNSGLQNQAVIYVAESLDAAPRVLLDPNQLSTDGTTSLSELEVSEDGSLLVYGISRAGSDWQEFRVREVATGRDRDDLVEWVKFSGASWLPDNSGFFYSRYDAPAPGEKRKGKNEFQKLYFHKLGTPQTADTLIYQRTDHPDWGFSGSVTEDGRYLVISISQGTDPRNRIYYKDLHTPTAGVVALLDDFDADYHFIHNEGPLFFFRTDLNAPRYRVIAIDLRQPERTAWREAVPQGPDKLSGANVLHGSLFCTYLKDARSVVRQFPWAASAGDPMVLPLPEPKEFPLPGIGSVGGFGGRSDATETFYTFTSYTEPGTIHRLDLATGQSRVWKRPSVDFDSAAYETRQVFVTGKDGTRFPIFITQKRGIPLDGKAPTLLYGYGGFNIPLTPSFSVSRAVWLENGGVYVVANLRGGGEYGADWHKAGTKLRKQNVFDDFIAAAEYLISQKVTQPSKLAIQGGSNGGLLVGACMTQRPDLFAVALPAVGVMDMLRFHKFTIGWAWKSDYGSSEDPDEFRALFAYSPYHNLKPGTRYPATLVTTADHDDRVVPAHSFKFAARLQSCQISDGPPVLIRIETSAGHGAGTALSKVISESTDTLAFLMQNIGL